MLVLNFIKNIIFIKNIFNIEEFTHDFSKKL